MSESLPFPSSPSLFLLPFFRSYPLVSTYNDTAWDDYTRETSHGSKICWRGGTFADCYTAACRYGAPLSPFLSKSAWAGCGCDGGAEQLPALIAGGVRLQERSGDCEGGLVLGGAAARPTLHRPSVPAAVNGKPLTATCYCPITMTSQPFFVRPPACLGAGSAASLPLPSPRLRR